MRLNQDREMVEATARSCALRLAVFLFTVLVAFSVSFSWTGHTDAFGQAYAANHHAGTAAGKAHMHQGQAHAVPCDDWGTDQGRQDSCCISASACGFCAPVPSAGVAFPVQGTPAAPESGSASLSRDPPTLRRPPKLSVIA